MGFCRHAGSTAAEDANRSPMRCSDHAPLARYSAARCCESYASPAARQSRRRRSMEIVPPARDLAVAELHRAHVAVHDTVARFVVSRSSGRRWPTPCAKVSSSHAVLGAAPVVVEKAAEAFRPRPRLRAHVIVVLEVGRHHRRDRGTIAPLGQVLQLLHELDIADAGQISS